MSTDPEQIHAGIAAHEIDDMHTARGRQHCQRFADRAIGGVLDHPVATCHFEEVQKSDRAERHGDKLRRCLIGDRIRDRDQPGSGREEIFSP